MYVLYNVDIDDGYDGYRYRGVGIDTDINMVKWLEQYLVYNGY